MCVCLSGFHSKTKNDKNNKLLVPVKDNTLQFCENKISTENSIVL